MRVERLAQPDCLLGWKLTFLLVYPILPLLSLLYPGVAPKQEKPQCTAKWSRLQPSVPAIVDGVTVARQCCPGLYGAPDSTPVFTH